MENICQMESPIGSIFIYENGNSITKITLQKPEYISHIKKTVLLEEAVKQLSEYFSGIRKIFSLPLLPSGTDFQKKVWNSLIAIPYGQTRTYGQIANQIGLSKAFRAVGMANHNNPIMIIIPCHRVIGANGKLVGYAGGLEIKKKLLQLEGALF